MTITVLIFAFVMCGFLDRVRGDTFSFGNKIIETFLYGLAVAICFDSPVWWTLPTFAALWTIGASFGWGVPIGAAISGRPMSDFPDRIHPWQIGMLKRNVEAALIVRGLIWGAIPAVLCVFDPRYIVTLLMAAIFPLAIHLAMKLKLKDDQWKEQELYRGWLIGLVAIITGVII